MPAFRRFAFLVFLGSIAVVGSALLFQYVGGLQPCELCLLERWPYYIVAPLSALALAAATRPVFVPLGNLGMLARLELVLAGGGRRLLLLSVFTIATLLFLSGAAVGFYHVGVEQHWFTGPTACTAPAAGATSIEALKAQLLQLQVVRCDEVKWSLFGISLAGWNFIASLALAGLSLKAVHAVWSLRRVMRARG